ncbi:MAG TPA: type II toxin-antitoxin system HicA family toxin [Bacillota bacterium]|nr:type II toxin-antitoxin system HicA family toxin [Bacillota bacterium]
MSTKEKLIKRLLKRPKDFTYEEAKALLNKLGYLEDNKGRTSGSRVSFYHHETKKIIILHKPHPDNVLKLYLIDKLIKTLKANGEI